MPTAAPENVLAIKIRPPSRDDGPALLTLVRELNVHQEEPTEHFDAAVLERDVFGKDSFLHTLVAERDGTLVGYAFFHDGYDSGYAQAGIYLCDLYVAEAAQGKGVGRSLVAAVSAKAKEMGRTYVWWTVKDWNEQAKAFYRSLGADSDPITAFALTFEHFEKLAEEGEGRK